MPVQRALHGETVRGILAILRHPRGKAAWISISAAPILAPEGRLLGAIASFSDVTALHELQEEIEDLLRSVSHDLRNPLTVI